MKDRQYTTKELFRRFQPYFKPYWKTLVLDLFCAGLTTLCELVLPMIMRYITNQGLYHLAELSVQTILGVVAIYLALRVVDCVATYYMAGVGHIMARKSKRTCAGTRISICISCQIPIIIIPRSDRSWDGLQTICLM